MNVDTIKVFLKFQNVVLLFAAAILLCQSQLSNLAAPKIAQRITLNSPENDLKWPQKWSNIKQICVHLKHKTWDQVHLHVRLDTKCTFLPTSS